MNKNLDNILCDISIILCDMQYMSMLCDMSITMCHM